MSKIYLYNDLYLPTFPYLDIPLYNELKLKNPSSYYILQAGDIRLFDKILMEKYMSLNPIIVKNIQEIPNLVGKDDLLIQRFCYKNSGGTVMAIAKSKSKKVLALDPAAVDVAFRTCDARYLAVKSEWMKSQVIKKYPAQYEKIFVTGTIHFDSSLNIMANKKQFMESYGLDTNKKLVIVCKAHPGEMGQQKNVDNEYKDIIKIINNKCQQYEFLFKAHPSDYSIDLPQIPGVIHKGAVYNNCASWRVLFPEGIKVVKPEEGYLSFACADLVINVRSSIGMETPLFPVPLINVNSHKYLVNWPKVNINGVMKNI